MMPKGALTGARGRDREESPGESQAQISTHPAPPNHCLHARLLPHAQSSCLIATVQSQEVCPIFLACKSPDHLICHRCKVTRAQTAIPQPWFVFLWTFKVYPVSFDVKTTPARDEASKVKVFRSALITPDSCRLITWVPLLIWDIGGMTVMSLCYLSPVRQCMTIMENLENTEYIENTRISNS